MTRHGSIRRWVATVLAGLVLVTAGCTKEPEPTPDAPVTYRRPAEGLCERIGLQDILRQRWQLSLPPGSENHPRYDAGPGSWYALCGFVGVAQDSRYATKGNFRPSGRVTITVYREVADAETQYNQEVKGYRKRVPLIDPGGSVTEVTGWWDAGVLVKLTTHPPGDALLGGPGITFQARELLVRHDNLEIRSSVEAYGPTKDKDEVGALLEAIATVVLDESVKHLPRTR